MEEDDDTFERCMQSEEKSIQKMLDEYKKIHLTMRCTNDSLKISGFWFEADDGDSTWYEIRLEDIYWQLDALGATQRTDAVEAANEAIIEKYKHTHLNRISHFAKRIPRFLAIGSDED